MFHLLMMVAACVLTAHVAIANEAIVWRDAPVAMRKADACLSLDNYALDRCPDANASLVIEGGTPFPQVLLQTSATGGLAWIGPNGQSRSILAERRHMVQALAARQLLDGSVLILSTDLVAGSTVLKFRPHLTLVGADGSWAWTVPVGGILSMETLDEVSGSVLEAPNGGDLYAVVNGTQMRILRVRRSDGRVEARADRPAVDGSTSILPATRATAAWSSAPFAVWLGPASLHVVSRAGWLRLDANLQSSTYAAWNGRLGANTEVRAFQPKAGSDEVFLMTRVPAGDPALAICGVSRWPVAGAAVWQSSIPACTGERVLERTGTGQLVFAGSLADTGPRLFIADEGTGSVHGNFGLSQRAVRLAVTPTHAAYVSSPVAVGTARITGVDLANGVELYQHDRPLSVTYPNTNFPDALVPHLATDGTAAFALHLAKVSVENSYESAVYTVTQTGNTRADIVPGDLAVPVETQILAHTAAGVLQGTLDRTIHPYRTYLTLRDLLTGQVRWQRTIDWQVIGTTTFLANDQHTLVFASQSLPSGGLSNWRVHLRLISNATGQDVYVDQREFFDPTLRGVLSASLTPDSHAVYALATSAGAHVLSLSATGQVALDQVLPRGGFFSRTDGGRLVSSDASELLLLDPQTGNARTLGTGNSAALPLDRGGSEDVWSVRTQLVGRQSQLIVQLRRPGVGMLWERSILLRSSREAIVLATTTTLDGDLVVELRTSVFELADHERRRVRFDGATGTIDWEDSEPLPPGATAGCRAYLKQVGPDLLCAHARSTTSAPSISGTGSLEVAVARIDAATGALRGVHWISSETEAHRSVFGGDGHGQRFFTAADGAGFAYTGPVSGSHFLTNTEAGGIRAPAAALGGDIALAVERTADGFHVEVTNSSQLATQIRWGIDATDSGAIAGYDCTSSMLAGADLQPFGARGSFNLAAGSSAHCDVQWVANLAVALRGVEVHALPAFDFLDTNGQNNIIALDPDRIFAGGFEGS